MSVSKETDIDMSGSDAGDIDLFAHTLYYDIPNGETRDKIRQNKPGLMSQGLHMLSGGIFMSKRMAETGFDRWGAVTFDAMPWLFGTKRFIVYGPETTDAEEGNSE